MTDLFVIFSIHLEHDKDIRFSCGLCLVPEPWERFKCIISSTIFQLVINNKLFSSNLCIFLFTLFLEVITGTSEKEDLQNF